MAGGNWRKVGGEAKYTATTFAKQGDLGSKVLPKAPSGTVWHRGEQETTVISIRANHGGGYAFRLCPAEAELSEECFEKISLPFVRNQQKLRWANGTELNISGTYISEGTHPPNSMWAMNP
eukprot:COSAG01_NODE_16750_length_1208_cov_1.572588_1_plen_120_part_10